MHFFEGRDPEPGLTVIGLTDCIFFAAFLKIGDRAEG